MLSINNYRYMNIFIIILFSVSLYYTITEHTEYIKVLNEENNYIKTQCTIEDHVPGVVRSNSNYNECYSGECYDVKLTISYKKHDSYEKHDSDNMNAKIFITNYTIMHYADYDVAAYNLKNYKIGDNIVCYHHKHNANNFKMNFINEEIKDTYYGYRAASIFLFVVFIFFNLACTIKEERNKRTEE